MDSKKKRWIIRILRFILLFVFGFCLAQLILGNESKVENISYSEVITCVREGEVSKIDAYQDSSSILVTFSDGTEKKVIVPSVDEFTAFVSEEIQKGADIEFTFKEKTRSFMTIISTILISFVMIVGITVIVITLFMGFTIKRISKSINKIVDTEKKSNEDDSETEEKKREVKKSIEELKNTISDLKGDSTEFKPVKSKVKFSDVAGIDEEKAQLEEVVKFLKKPEIYHKNGVRIPRGILLNGAPGTGKTLLAKAVAGESGVPFFAVTGSSFEEKYVGVGASRMRDLFEQAKKVAPCIIFIDEIDSVAQKRYQRDGYACEETLNQLLAEMDGFETKENVIVMAATNHIDTLDEALVRAGRFDRHVFIPMPDVIAREKILKVHARNKNFNEEVSLAEIARKTVGFSGADLECVLNEAAIHSINHGIGVITKADIEESIARVLVGLAKKNSAITEEEKWLTAVHEAGHAIASRLVRPEVKNFGISIVPRGNAGGYNFFDELNKAYQTKTDLFKQIQVLYGGRIAEELMLGDISTGASSDLEKASKIAYQMVTRYAMNGRFLTKISGEADFNDQMASSQTEDIEKICKKAYDETTDVLRSNTRHINALATLLMEKEYLPQEEVEEFMLQVKSKK